MNIERVGLDLDGVLYPWDKAIYTYFRCYRGYTGTQFQFSNDLHKLIPWDFKDFLLEVGPLYMTINPDLKVMHLLNDLAKKYELFYVTSRPEVVRLSTEKYLRIHNFPNKENLYFTNDKANLARYLELDYFIEDNIVNAFNISKVCATYVVKQPWNQDFLADFHVLNTILDFGSVLNG